MREQVQQQIAALQAQRDTLWQQIRASDQWCALMQLDGAIRALLDLLTEDAVTRGE